MRTGDIEYIALVTRGGWYDLRYIGALTEEGRTIANRDDVEAVFVIKGSPVLLKVFEDCRDRLSDGAPIESIASLLCKK